MVKALATADGKRDYAHLLAGWRTLRDSAPQPPLYPPAPRAGAHADPDPGRAASGSQPTAMVNS